MAAAAGSFVEEFSEETTCSICMEYFTDPVILDCGHNFCRACLTRTWEEPDRVPSCPHCRVAVPRRKFRPNRQLASIVEITKKYSLQEAQRAETLCKTHEEPLKLFCRDEGALICVVCDRSKEHHDHRVVPMEEAAQEYKVGGHRQSGRCPVLETPVHHRLPIFCSVLEGNTESHCLEAEAGQGFRERF